MGGLQPLTASALVSDALRLGVARLFDVVGVGESLRVFDDPVEALASLARIT